MTKQRTATDHAVVFVLWPWTFFGHLSLVICDGSFSSASSFVNEGDTVHPRARLASAAVVAGDRAGGAVAVQSVVHGRIRAHRNQGRPFVREPGGCVEAGGAGDAGVAGDDVDHRDRGC